MRQPIGAQRRSGDAPLAARLASAVLLGALAVAGCAGDEPPAPRGCPRPAILAGLETNSVFRSGASTGPAADLAYTVGMQGIAGGCTYEDEGLTVDLSVDILVEPGPAYAGPSVAVPWFVAVAGPDGTVLDKQSFRANVAVEPGATRGGSRESVQQRFPGIGPDVGPGYRIYLGLTIPREEALRRRAQLP
jgi:hypothetical protein